MACFGANSVGQHGTVEQHGMHEARKGSKEGGDWLGSTWQPTPACKSCLTHSTYKRAVMDTRGLLWIYTWS